MFHLKCIVSDEDGNTLLKVDKTPKLELVADLLAKVTGKLTKLVKYLGEKYPTRENVKRLTEKFNPRKLWKLFLQANILLIQKIKVRN